MEVPLFVTYLFPPLPGAQEMMSIPGTTRSGLHTQSLVGPRPERPFFAQQFEREIPQYAYRFRVKAGLAALSHVYGRYSTFICDRTYYDLRYIAGYSFLWDIRILLLTGKTLFLPNAAEGEDEYKRGENTQTESR